MSLYMVSLGKFKFSKVIPTKIYRKMLKIFLKILKNYKYDRSPNCHLSYKIHKVNTQYAGRKGL